MNKNKKKKTNNRRKRKPFYKRPGIYIFLIVCFILGIVGLFLFDHLILKEFRERATTYDYDKVGEVEIPSQIFDRRGELIGRSYEENRSVVKIDEIPAVFINALLAQEDQRFWEHNGVDWTGVLRAVYLNAKAGETTQGASTITMQLARNAFNLQEKALEREESGMERKILEAFVALEIEKRYVGDGTPEERYEGKCKLLEMYLNRVHFGKGYYGIRAASLGFFGKEPGDLSLSESASMVACIKNPRFINPIENPERNKKDRNHVFNRMFAEGTIPTREEYETLCESPIVINPRPLRRGTSHLYDKVVEITRKIVGDDAMSRGGFSIYTTVDKRVQNAATESLQEQLVQIEQTEGYSHPKLAEYKKENGDPKYLRGSVLVTDSTSGAVIAYVAGRNFEHSQYDFIEAGRRPLGTAFLPVVYTAAFENDRSPATLLSDRHMDAREVALGGSEGILGEWGSEIPDPIYENDITARKALRDSKISATVRLGVDIGISTVAQQATSFKLPLESGEMLARLLLGWEQNSLWQATRMYSAFSRGGIAPESTYFIEYIVNSEGEEVYRAPRKQALTVQMCSETSAYQVHSILADVTKNGNLKDSAKNLTEPEVAVVKTGTNHNFSDSWALGYNGEVTCGVWVGFLSKRRPIHDFAFAKDLAYPIWSATMNEAANQFPGKPVSMPPTLTEVQLCEKSGRQTTRYCYDSVFDPERGAALASTAYTEYLRVTEAQVGLCPLHGEGGVAPSGDFGPDTEEFRQRLFDVDPISIRTVALIGDDPYGSVTPQTTAIEEEEEQNTEEEEEEKEAIAKKPERGFIPRNTRRGEKESTIQLRAPGRIELIKDE